MDNTFVLCPNIIGLLALILLLIFTRFNFYLNDKRLKLFVAAAICNAVIVALEVSDYLLAQTPFAAAFLVRRVTSAICFALTPVIPLLIAYIASKKNLPRWTLIPATLNAALSFASVFTGDLFYIDEFNSYYRGPLFTVMFVISLFYLLLLVYVSYRNIKGVRSGEAVFLFGIVGEMLAANVLEIVFSFHFVIWNCCGVLLMAYYLFLHIQYFKYDQMTGVFNRSMFSYDLGRLRHEQSIGIVSLDLNGLKRINDTGGHEKGDAYIVASAELIVRCFRDVGHAYRIGGDEFVVLVQNTTRDAICDKLEYFGRECEKAGLSIACGFSYADNADDVSQMLRNADDAMYDNKRNRMTNR